MVVGFSASAASAPTRLYGSLTAYRFASKREAAHRFAATPPFVAGEVIGIKPVHWEFLSVECTVGVAALP